MPYQIIIEFPNKEVSDIFCGQMSDGFGENLCDFSHWKQTDGTDGTKKEHFKKMLDETGRSIYYVNEIFEP